MSNKGRDRWGPLVWEWIYRYGKTQARAKNQKTTPRQAAAAATEAEGEDEGERGGFATRRRPPKRDHQAQTANSIAFKRSPLLCSTDRVLSFSLPLLPFFFSLRRLPRFALIQQCSHAHVNFSCPLGHGRRQRRRDRQSGTDERTTDNAVSNFLLPCARFPSHNARLSWRS